MQTFTERTGSGAMESMAGYWMGQNFTTEGINGSEASQPEVNVTGSNRSESGRVLTEVNITGPAFMIQLTVAVGILLANISILIVLSRYRVMNTVMHSLFRSLAMADLLMGLATILRQILLALYGTSLEDVPLRCTPAVTLFVLSGGTSVSSLMFVAIGQWYIASRPLTVEQKRRHNRIMQRCIRLSWMAWSALGLCCLPATRRAGTFDRLENPCLLTGPYIHYLYWQICLQLLVVMSITTVVFQCLSLRCMRAALQRLLMAVKQRHEPYMTVLPGSTRLSANQGTLNPNHSHKSTLTAHGGLDQWADMSIDLTFSGESAQECFMARSGISRRGGGRAGGAAGAGGDQYELELAKTRMNLSTTLTLVMVLFAMCWLMYLPAAIILSACTTDLCGRMQNKVAFIGILPILNSLMNAIVYPMRLKPYRRAMLKILCPMKSRNVIDPQTELKVVTKSNPVECQQE